MTKYFNPTVFGQFLGKIFQIPPLLHQRQRHVVYEFWLPGRGEAVDANVKCDDSLYLITCINNVLGNMWMDTMVNNLICMADIYQFKEADK